MLINPSLGRVKFSIVVALINALAPIAIVCVNTTSTKFFGIKYVLPDWIVGTYSE